MLASKVQFDSVSKNSDMQSKLKNWLVLLTNFFLVFIATASESSPDILPGKMSVSRSKSICPDQLKVSSANFRKYTEKSQFVDYHKFYQVQWHQFRLQAVL